MKVSSLPQLAELLPKEQVPHAVLVLSYQRKEAPTLLNRLVEAIEGNSLEVDGIRYTIGRSYLNEAKSRILNDTIT